VEQSAFEAAQLLGRREHKLAAEVGAAKAKLQELTARLQKVKAGMLEEMEGEGQVLNFITSPYPVCSQEVEDEEHCLINCSHYEDIRARCASLFKTRSIVSLEEFFQKDQALIAKYVEECYVIHGGSSVI